jgi:hypothetical protein
LASRFHSSPQTIQSPPCSPLGLHPLAAAEKSSCLGIFCCLSSLRFMSYSLFFSFRPSIPVPGSAYLLAPPFGPECLTSLADASICRVGGGALARWPPSAAQTARTVFPYAAFTKSSHSVMPMKESLDRMASRECCFGRVKLHRLAEYHVGRKQTPLSLASGLQHRADEPQHPAVLYSLGTT